MGSDKLSTLNQRIICVITLCVSLFYWVDLNTVTDLNHKAFKAVIRTANLIFGHTLNLNIASIEGCSDISSIGSLKEQPYLIILKRPGDSVLTTHAILLYQEELGSFVRDVNTVYALKGDCDYSGKLKAYLEERYSEHRNIQLMNVESGATRSKLYVTMISVLLHLFTCLVVLLYFPLSPFLRKEV